MSLERLQREFAFEDWANREVLSALERAGTPPSDCLRWLAHILGTQSEWLARLEARKSALAVWPALELREFAALLAEQRLAWARFLDRCESVGLGRTIAYTNSKGEAWTSRVDDVLTHVLLHGAYHRGQIASAMRAAGFPPPYTDFIHAARSGFLSG